MEISLSLFKDANEAVRLRLKLCFKWPFANIFQLAALNEIFSQCSHGADVDFSSSLLLSAEELVSLPQH